MGWETWAYLGGIALTLVGLLVVGFGIRTVNRALRSYFDSSSKRIDGLASRLGAAEAEFDQRLRELERRVGGFGRLR